MELKNNESINKTNTNSSHLGKDGKPKKTIKKDQTQRQACRLYSGTHPLR